MTLRQTPFITMAYQLNAALDKRLAPRPGETRTTPSATIEEVRKAADAGTLTELLEKITGEKMGHGLFDEATRKEVDHTLNQIAGGLWGQEGRKLDVDNDGLSLALAYCIQAIASLQPPL